MSLNYIPDELFDFISALDSEHTSVCQKSSDNEDDLLFSNQALNYEDFNQIYSTASNIRCSNDTSSSVNININDMNSNNTNNINKKNDVNNMNDYLSSHENHQTISNSSNTYHPRHASSSFSPETRHSNSLPISLPSLSRTSNQSSPHYSLHSSPLAQSHTHSLKPQLPFLSPPVSQSYPQTSSLSNFQPTDFQSLTLQPHSYLQPQSSHFLQSHSYLQPQSSHFLQSHSYLQPQSSHSLQSHSYLQPQLSHLSHTSNKVNPDLYTPSVLPKRKPGRKPKSMTINQPLLSIDEKKVERQKKNREAADISRQRRRERMTGLEMLAWSKVVENGRLKEAIQRLELVRG